MGHPHYLAVPCFGISVFCLCFLWLHTPRAGCHTSRWEIRQTDFRLISLGVKPRLGQKTRFLLTWGALSNKRTGLSITSLLTPEHDRPTVSRSVSIAVRHPSGAHYQTFITVTWGFVHVVLYVWREDGRLQLQLVLASIFILVSESHETHDHISMSGFLQPGGPVPCIYMPYASRYISE
jgi:hypothetical protein